jgi:hypothetical protein
MRKPMISRTALEDAVFDAYGELDMSQIERMPQDKLEYLLEVAQGKRKIPKPKGAEKPESQKKPPKPKTVREKTYSGYEVRDNALVYVERWHISNSAGNTEREYVEQCGDRVNFEGRVKSSNIVKHYLLTGEWVKRVPKPKRYRAAVRVGRLVLHLGYFASPEERDAAIFAYKLGITD